MIDVVHFHRRPAARNFSIERLFGDVRAALPADIRCRVEVSPHVSRGFLPRWKNIRAARRTQGAVNHITGDVHFLAYGLPRERTILTVHDCANLERLHGWRRRVLRQFWFDGPLARSGWITAVSEATKADLARWLGERVASRVQVIPNCVSPEFVPQPVARNPVPRILMLGTAPNKNLERCAEALRGRNCRVELIGTPGDAQRAAFAAAGVELEAVGDVTAERIRAAYANCDVVLFASTLEGFGMPILEAQATGRAVVTSNCSSMPSVAGDSACLVDPFSEAAIRAGVDRVLDDATYRDALIARGFVNVRRFAPAAIAEQYARLYREVARVNASPVPTCA